MSRRNLNVIVLSTQRSGSTWFIDELYGRVPKGKVYSEVFLSSRGECSSNPQKKQWSHLLPEVGWPEFQDKVAGLKVQKVKKYINYLRGEDANLIFKLMGNQVTIPIAINALLGGFKLIRLERKNILEQIVSSAQSRETKLPHSTDPKVERPAVRLHPNRTVNDVKKALDSLSRREAIYRAWPFEKIQFIYESLCENNDFPVEHLSGLLGVRIPEIESGSVLKKLDARPLDERIINYPEIRDALLSAGLFQAAVPEF